MKTIWNETPPSTATRIQAGRNNRLGGDEKIVRVNGEKIRYITRRVDPSVLETTPEPSPSTETWLSNAAISEIYQQLLAAETDGQNAADLRRIISEERCSLHAALQSDDQTRINAVALEARRVLKLWLTF